MTICVIWVLIRGPGVLDIGESEPMGLNIPERKIFSTDFVFIIIFL